MKIIKGFEGEDLKVSDFGEWVGKDYIDYKSEYENNQKIIKLLVQKNQKQKEVIDKAIEKLQMLIDIGLDYDGFNQIDSLKTLIDEIVIYAKETRNILKEVE